MFVLVELEENYCWDTGDLTSTSVVGTYGPYEAHEVGAKQKLLKKKRIVTEIHELKDIY